MKLLSLISITAIILLMFMLPGVSTEAATPSPTATVTRTATFTNDQIIRLGTIAPPPSCGGVYVPCGPLPYQVPPFPTLNLPSPTIVDSYGLIIGATPVGATNTPGGPTSTNQPTLDRPSIQTMGAGLNNMVSTLSAQGTQYVVNGTPVSIGTLAAGFGTNAGSVFAYVKGLQDSFVNIGGAIPVVLAVLVFMLLVVVAITTLSIIVWVIKFVLQIIETVTP